MTETIPSGTITVLSYDDLCGCSAAPPACVLTGPGAASTQQYTLAVSGATVTGTGVRGPRALTLQATRDSSTIRGTIVWPAFSTSNSERSAVNKDFTASKP